MNSIPNAPGVYILVLYLSQTTAITFNRKSSRLSFPPGWYVYVGSARGPGGLTRDESTAGLSIETVQSGRFTGQVIRDGERIVYASLPVTRKWLASNKWQMAKPFAI
jgi:hypothetical protein